MVNRIKGEFLKELYNTKLWITCGIVLFLVMLIFLWQGYLSGGDLREKELLNATSAGVYGMLSFATVFRRILGILVGFALINIEVEDQKLQYSVSVTGRINFILTKIIFGIVISFAVSIISFTLPFVVSLIFGDGISASVGVMEIVGSLFLTWIFTFGNVIIGIFLGFMVKNYAPVVAVLIFLEFGQGMCPKAITDIWKHLDGYWYSANLFKPLESITEKINNFQVIYTSDFKGAEGFGIWSLGLIAAVFVLIMMARKMDC